jgi:sec-independent protein translocase protein TatA
MWEGLLRPTHLLVILAVVIVLFGPKRFPEFGKALGSGFRGLRSMFESKDVTSEVPQNRQGTVPVREVKGLVRDSSESDGKS